MPRYRSNRQALLDSPIYSDVFEKRGVKFLRIFRTKTFSGLEDLEFEVSETHTWSFGDTLFRLSYKFYVTYEYWWTISLVNNKPTDAHFKLGDEVLIITDHSRLAVAVG